MPSLKPRSISPSSASAGTRQSSNRELAQRVRCGEHLRSCEAKSRRVRRHDERGDPAAARPGRGPREDHVHVGEPGIRNQMFLAVEHPRCRRRAAPSSRAPRHRSRRQARSSQSPPSTRPSVMAGSQRSRCAVDAAEHDGRAAQPLQRDDRVGQRTHRRDDLAHDAHRPQVLLGDRRAASPRRQSPAAAHGHRCAPPRRLRARAVRADALRSTPAPARPCSVCDRIEERRDCTAPRRQMVGHERLTRTSPAACRGRPRTLP